MSLPELVVAHESPGRLRLRLKYGESRDKACLKLLRERLIECASVREVQTNNVTGSVLVLFEGGRGEVERYLADAEVARIVPRPLPEPRARNLPVKTAELGDELADLHAPEPLFGRGRGARGLSMLTGSVLVGLAGVQAVRGMFLPAGLTLAFKGFDFMGARR